MTQKVIIYGTGDLAEQYFWQLKSDDRYVIVGFCEHSAYCKQNKLFDLPIYKYEELCIHNANKQEILFLVAIGYSKMNTIRQRVLEEIQRGGFSLLTYIAKSATVGENVKIGKGCFIGEKSILYHCSEIGDGCIIYPNTVIGENTKVGNFVFCSISVTTGGSVQIFNNSFIGLNSTIKNSITIAEFCLIGSAANVVYNTEERGVYVGNPAKRIKEIDIEKVEI